MPSLASPFVLYTLITTYLFSLCLVFCCSAIGPCDFINASTEDGLFKWFCIIHGFH